MKSIFIQLIQVAILSQSFDKMKSRLSIDYGPRLVCL